MKTFALLVILGMLVLCAPVLLGGQPTTAPAAPVKEISPTTQEITKILRESRMDLWRAHVSALTDRYEPPVAQAAQLENLKLASKFVPPVKATSAPATLPATLPAVVQTVVAKAPTTALAQASQPTTQGAVQPVLEKLRQSSLQDPLTTADSFFGAGRLKEAAALYEQAIQSGRYKEQLDWLLFQLAICKESENLPRAAELYIQLQNQCPKSPWVPMANARLGIVQWLLSQEVQSSMRTDAGTKGP